MRRLRFFIAKYVLWGSTPPAFVSGLSLSVGANMITSLALLSVQTRPTHSTLLLFGSALYVVSSAAFMWAAQRVQPFKSLSDERLRERRRLLRRDEVERSEVEYIWDEVLDAERKGDENVRELLVPLILGLLLFLLGTLTYVVALAFSANIK